MRHFPLAASLLLCASASACKSSQAYESAQAILCTDKQTDSLTEGRMVTLTNLMNGKTARGKILYKKTINNAVYVGIDKETATRLQMQYTGLAPVEIRQ